MFLVNLKHVASLAIILSLTEDKECSIIRKNWSKSFSALTLRKIVDPPRSYFITRLIFRIHNHSYLRGLI
jgi:hypothetical protein